MRRRHGSERADCCFSHSHSCSSPRLSHCLAVERVVRAAHPFCLTRNNITLANTTRLHLQKQSFIIGKHTSFKLNRHKLKTPQNFFTMFQQSLPPLVWSKLTCKSPNLKRRDIREAACRARELSDLYLELF